MSVPAADAASVDGFMGTKLLVHEDIHHACTICRRCESGEHETVAHYSDCGGGYHYLESEG
ncbi:MAG: hypothetical protein ACU85U_11980 [Gammaproteobacteria bacterium]|jgi:hypothetical protein